MTVHSNIDQAMIDRGTPARESQQTVTLEIDGIPVTVPAGTSIMRASSARRHPGARSCARPIRLESFGSCRLCLVEIEGRRGTPASCTTPAENGMKVFTQTDRIAKLRRGVMELYISDHPLDCLTCAANGDCELQDMAGAVGLREVRYGYDGENHLASGEGRVQPVFHLRSVEVHRLLALRSRLRRGSGHVRAHHRRPRLREPRLGGHEPGLPRIRMRLVRRLRAGLPDRDADGKDRHPARHAGTVGDHDLRLLRRRLHVRGRASGRPRRAHDAVQRRQGQSRALVREGPFCLGLRDAQGTHHEADDPRLDQGSLARSDLGRGDQAHGVASSSASRRNTARARSAASPRRAAPTKKPS